MLIPGANVFLTDRDVTTEPDAEGNRLIICRPLSGTEEARLAYRGLRILEQILGGIPLP